MSRLFKLCSLVLLCVPHLASASELLEAIRRYEGRWAGHFTIHSAATGYSETFPVEQQYWMAGEKLHGVSVSQRDSGLSSSRSVTYVVEDKLLSEITTGDKTETFIGVLHDAGVLWIPEDIRRANDQQLKESILVEEGELRIKTEGFDSYVFKDGLAHIVFRGNLVFQKPKQ